MEWENHLEKKPIQKIENSEHQSEIAACDQKTTSEKAIFVQTPFSLSPFHSTSCFGVTKITTPI